MTYGPRRVTPAADRILSRSVEDESGCWVYQGHLNNSGYVVVNIGRRGEGKVAGHRATFEHFRGEIPEGLVLDHLCRNTACVNPWHLEPVTNQVNTLRGDAMFNGQHNARKTHCAKGHEFTETNTYRDKKNQRHCIECGRIKSRNYQRELRARKASAA